MWATNTATVSLFWNTILPHIRTIMAGLGNMVLILALTVGIFPLPPSEREQVFNNEDEQNEADQHQG